MPSWNDFAEQAPELAEKVRERLDAHRHKTIATIRSDGSPRISAIEAEIADGELWTGSMWQALKARDLQRDPRFALHSGTDEPSDFKGDAKVAGIAEEITDPELVRKRNGEATSGPSHLFRLDLREASVVGVDSAANKLVIEVWRAGEGVRRMERA
jgi:Pyridoxamine 5'-phosphate oxidase